MSKALTLAQCVESGIFDSERKIKGYFRHYGVKLDIVEMKVPMLFYTGVRTKTKKRLSVVTADDVEELIQNVNESIKAKKKGSPYIDRGLNLICRLAQLKDYILAYSDGKSLH